MGRPRQIANAHTAFNVTNTCLFFWLTGPLTRFVMLVVPMRPEAIPEAARPQYIQGVYLKTPGIALDSIRRETVRLGELIIQLASDARSAVVSGTEDDLDAIVARAGENEWQLLKLQTKLCHLQEWVRHQGLRVVVVFEGRDAAGKGGTIKRITERVNPRVFRTVALPAPFVREKTQHFSPPRARSCSMTEAGTTGRASNA